MADNILRAGFELVVTNRTPDRARELVQKGARFVPTPAEVMHQADLVGICVTDGAALRAVLTGPSGALSAMRRGQWMVDHSTIAPDEAQHWGHRARDQGVEFLDAPVTGGDQGARAGTLTIMVGGSANGFRAIGPYLQAIGRTIVHVGPSGQGQLVKLVNNLIGGAAMVAASEGLALGLRAGVPLPVLMQVLSAGSADSVSLRLLAERLTNDSWQPGFSLRNRCKDMALARDAAEAMHLPLPVGEAATTVFLNRLAQGDGEMDQTVVIAPYLAHQP